MFRARSRNLRNPRITLRNLGILTLARNPRIAHRIHELRTFLREALSKQGFAQSNHRIAQYDLGILSLARKGIA